MNVSELFKDDPARRIHNADARFEAVRTPAGEMRLRGYAMVWGASCDRSFGKATILPNSVILGDNTFALYHHDWGRVLGCTAAGTLKLAADATGLAADIRLPNTTFGRDVYEAVKRRDVKGMSFAIGDVQEHFESTDPQTGKLLVEFAKFSITEVSVTPVPAFTETSLACMAAGGDDAIASARVQDVRRLDRMRLGLLNH